MRVPTLVLIALGLALVPIPVDAQGLEESRIQGVVRDPSGAVVPDVRVLLSGSTLIGGSRITTTSSTRHLSVLAPAAG